MSWFECRCSHDGYLVCPLPHVGRLRDALLNQVAHDAVHLVSDEADVIRAVLYARELRLEQRHYLLELRVELAAVLRVTRTVQHGGHAASVLAGPAAPYEACVRARCLYYALPTGATRVC